MWLFAKHGFNNVVCGEIKECVGTDYRDRTYGHVLHDVWNVMYRHPERERR